MAVDTSAMTVQQLKRGDDTVSPVTQLGGKGNISAFNDPDGPSFSDLLDILNPLQHIPVVNTIYEKLTGDTEGAVADVVGGALYGSVVGLGAALANLAVKDSTGQDISGNLIAMVSGDDQPATAQAQAPATPPPAAVAVEVLAPPAITTAQTAPQPAAVSDGPLRAGDYLVFGGDSLTPAAPVAPTAAAGDGPVRASDYLIFGAGTTGAPIPLTPAAQIAAAAAAPAANAGQAGNFTVFGGDGRPADHLPAAPPPTAGTDGGQGMAATGGNGRFFPMPARRGPAAPPSQLPMPTTGPDAVPGNAHVGAPTTPPSAGNPESSPWFSGAFNEAMDKYQRAARLGATNDGNPAAATPAN